MSITDELREAISELRVECEEKEGCGVLWYPEPPRDRFSEIADRIDEQVRRDYIPLPVDADGEPIHLQDRMSWDNGTFNVHELKLTADGWTTWDELHGYTVRADQCHHVTPDSWESIISEFAERVLRSGHQWGLDAPAATAEFVERCKKLAGDAE